MGHPKVEGEGHADGAQDDARVLRHQRDLRRCGKETQKISLLTKLPRKKTKPKFRYVNLNPAPIIHLFVAFFSF